MRRRPANCSSIVASLYPCCRMLGAGLIRLGINHWTTHCQAALTWPLACDLSDTIQQAQCQSLSASCRPPRQLSPCSAVSRSHAVIPIATVVWSLQPLADQEKHCGLHIHVRSTSRDRQSGQLSHENAVNACAAISTICRANPQRPSFVHDVMKLSVSDFALCSLLALALALMALCPRTRVLD